MRICLIFQFNFDLVCAREVDSILFDLISLFVLFEHLCEGGLPKAKVISALSHSLTPKADRIRPSEDRKIQQDCRRSGSVPHFPNPKRKEQLSRQVR